jgi:uncharacterized 2Fe-2S/4Fe-4S cluster protein (DUF4445 family)
MAITVEIVSHRLKVRAARGRLLSDVLAEAGLPLSLYCRGRGLCGRCFVEILTPPRAELKDREASLLALRGLSPDHRLACLYVLARSIKVSIPAASLLERMPVLDWGVETTVELDPAVKKYALELVRPDLGRPEAAWEVLARALKIDRPTAGLDVVRSLSPLLGRDGGKLTAVVHMDREVLALEAGDTTARSLGLAVDLGTTTLVMDIVDLSTGRVLGSETALNGQTSYGLDVVSRISRVFAEPAEGERLQRTVVRDLDRMASALLERTGLDRGSVYEVVVAGNTAMNHLLTRVPISSLALAPFHPVFAALPPLPARDIGLELGPQARLYIAPNIKSFVGGDISAGLLASGFLDRTGTWLYLDLGTNGEIALKAGGDVLVTSTAAGPAFEGMNISHGMLALPGAIARAENEGGLKVYTIGDRPAKGICGTGLIDIVAVGRELGLISAQGAVTGPGKRIPAAPGIALEQKDVRELQLAAGAIKTGVKMMLSAAGLRASGLDGVLIAGAFGNTLNIGRAMAIGLLPSIDPDRIAFLGNASLAGARALLLSQASRGKLEGALAAIRHLSLASEASFQDHFIGSLEFTPWS